jgi:hypothetical protein
VYQRVGPNGLVMFDHPYNAEYLLGWRISGSRLGPQQIARICVPSSLSRSIRFAHSCLVARVNMTKRDIRAGWPYEQRARRELWLNDLRARA